MRECRRVEGGSVCGVHVLFVNRPAGKKDTWFYSASHPGIQSKVQWEVGVE